MLQLLSDPVPRVQSHALSSLSNFLDECSKDMVAPYLEQGL